MTETLGILAEVDQPGGAPSGGASARRAPASRRSDDDSGDPRAQLPAVLGGRPAFDRLVTVGRPNLPEPGRFLPRVTRVLASGRLSNFGPEVASFEARVASLVGARHAVSTCNATVALELLLRTLEWRGEVILPSFTFIADAHAVRAVGAIPVFCDIDPATHCLDPAAVEAAITPRTSGILGVHLWGDRSAARALESVAERHGVPLVFDAAHAFGCAERHPPARLVGRAEVYSFHATKLVHTGEGGVVVTDDASLAAELRRRTNFGFAGEDDVVAVGSNAKLQELSAAMGHAMLDRLDAIVDHNRRNFQAYAIVLAALPGVSLRYTDTGQRHSYHYVVAEVDQDRAGLTRDELVAALRLENVIARRYFHPGCHRAVPYRDARVELPMTEAVAERTLILPTGLAVSPDDARRLAFTIANLVARAHDVRDALSRCRDPRLPEYFVSSAPRLQT